MPASIIAGIINALGPLKISRIPSRRANSQFKGPVFLPVSSPVTGSFSRLRLRLRPSQILGATMPIPSCAINDAAKPPRSIASITTVIGFPKP